MDCHLGCHTSLSPLLCMAGTTGLEPATSAVTGQRSDQLSYVPRLFFNNLVICHIESSASQLSLFSLFSTLSLVCTQFRGFLDTKWTPSWTPNQPTQQRDLVYQMRGDIGVHLPGRRAKPVPEYSSGNKTEGTAQVRGSRIRRYPV